MLDTTSKLIAEFLKDHQQFARLLYEIEKLLGSKKVPQARERRSPVPRRGESLHAVVPDGAIAAADRTIHSCPRGPWRRLWRTGTAVFC